MNVGQIIRSAVQNTFRSRVRTMLTMLAIFVGAFTLTITNGVGTGIKRYIDMQVAAFGSFDIMFIMNRDMMHDSGFSNAPKEYNPEQSTLSGFSGRNIPAMTPKDLEAIANMPYLYDVEALKIVAPEYITRPGAKQYEIMMNQNPAGVDMDIAAGRGIPANEPKSELILPWSYLEVLQFASAEEALGATVTIGMRSVSGEATVVETTIVGVQHDTLFASGGLGSTGLIDELYAAQMKGIPPIFANVYAGAMAHIKPNISRAERQQLRQELREAGFAGVTVEDQLGAIHTVINAVIGVLNAFSIIALLAAGLGIVNTLFMSVQERTREIGLMKAMGMGAVSIFFLFSTEAVVIGVLGSAIGALGAVLSGNAISTYLANGPLADLAGLQIIAFEPLQVLGVIGLVMLIAFLAGTTPAARAARLHPIDALRYE